MACRTFCPVSAAKVLPNIPASHISAFEPLASGAFLPVILERLSGPPRGPGLSFLVQDGQQGRSIGEGLRDFRVRWFLHIAKSSDGEWIEFQG